MTRAGEEGASLVEYVLLVALLVMVTLLGLRFLGNSTSEGIEQDTSFINEGP